MPSFDLNRPFDGPSPDLVVGDQDHMDCLPLYGISPDGKNYIAFLQETDDVEPLGNWSCRILSDIYQRLLEVRPYFPGDTNVTGHCIDSLLERLEMQGAKRAFESD
ncbi:MAG: hypothetical protein LW834_22250 [Cyanobium sp. 49614_E6]|nr:hypothetical protein [Cyanobium sp. 49614_E6]